MKPTKLNTGNNRTVKNLKVFDAGDRDVERENLNRILKQVQASGVPGPAGPPGAAGAQGPEGAAGTGGGGGLAYISLGF